MKKMGIDPNFYTSEPYITLSGGVCHKQFHWIWIEADDWLLFPPLTDKEDNLKIDYAKIWSDFDNHNIYDYLYAESDIQLTFLDWEYIYNPLRFKDLSGNKWEVFRKNIRKWPKNNSNWVYTEEINKKECFKLLGYWLMEKSKSVQDAELMIKYIEHDNGIGKKALYRGKEMVSLNIWDENYKFINYRFCFVDHSEPFLDEFTRYLFYTDDLIIRKNKLINDGGVVGNHGLEHFKDKLNPVFKRQVFSILIRNTLRKNEDQ